MKLLTGLFLGLLLSSCAAVTPAPVVLTPKEVICKTANEYVENGEAAVNAETADKRFESEVEACGLVADTGLGFAIYHINGWSKPDGKYLGHMKRMIVYTLQDGRWVSAQEGTVAFIPPPSQPEPVDPQRGLSL